MNDKISIDTIQRKFRLNFLVAREIADYVNCLIEQIEDNKKELLKDFKEGSFPCEKCDERSSCRLGGFVNRTENYVSCDKLKDAIEYDGVEICPKCGNKSVKPKGIYNGGGVACTHKGCGYWFCY